MEGMRWYGGDGSDGSRGGGLFVDEALEKEMRGESRIYSNISEPEKLGK